MHAQLVCWQVCILFCWRRCRDLAQVVQAPCWVGSSREDHSFFLVPSSCTFLGFGVKNLLLHLSDVQMKCQGLKLGLSSFEIGVSALSSGCWSTKHSVVCYNVTGQKLAFRSHPTCLLLLQRHQRLCISCLLIAVCTMFPSPRSAKPDQGVPPCAVTPAAFTFRGLFARKHSPGEPCSDNSLYTDRDIKYSQASAVVWSKRGERSQVQTLKGVKASHVPG